MKVAFENIVKAIKDLQPNSQNYIIKQLREINNGINGLMAINDSYKRQLTGVNEKQYNDMLFKSIELLKIFGFNEFTFVGLNPDFLVWFFENTQTNAKFNPKLMNFYLLDSMQQAYYICVAQHEGEKPTYKEVKQTMLTFDEQIKTFESELKLSLPQLIAKIDGQN